MDASIKTINSKAIRKIPQRGFMSKNLCYGNSGEVSKKFTNVSTQHSKFNAFFRKVELTKGYMMMSMILLYLLKYLLWFWVHPKPETQAALHCLSVHNFHLIDIQSNSTLAGSAKEFGTGVASSGTRMKEIKAKTTWHLVLILSGFYGPIGEEKMIQHWVSQS